MWIVGAEVSRLDPSGQVLAERGIDLSDFVDSRFDSLGDARTCPFGFGRRGPVSAAESDGSGQMSDRAEPCSFYW